MNIMKRILFFILISVILFSCGGSGNGELVGAYDRVTWNPTDPYGMVFVPQGSFMMGPSEQDVPFANVSTNQRASVGAFYMDETEITNNEYRQFENWVVDSIIRTELEVFQKDRRTDVIKMSGYTTTILAYPRIEVFSDEDWDTYDIEKNESTDPFDWDTTFFKIDKSKGMKEEKRNLPKIDWAERISPEKKQELYNNIFVKAVVDGNIVKKEDAFVYRYEELDVRSFSEKNQKSEEAIDRMSAGEFRNQFVVERTVGMYPSTLDYQSDYVYSNNETDATFRYEHVAYDDYPIVGITWDQANAFCHWRTHIMNEFLRARNEPLLPDFRLPTETEWEYAARGGLALSPYPWGGPYTRNDRGCFLANFKPLRGNYTADGGLKAIKVGSYNPNNYGLYDMAGNVSEWTSTVYDETSSSYSHDMNSDNSRSVKQMQINGEDEFKRKVIRGGSWKDISYFIRNSTRSYEYADVSTSYIGFRCVMDFLGRDKKDFQ